MYERYINRLPLAPGDLACKCPDRELNQRPFGSQASTKSTEPHQPGHIISFNFHNTTMI